MSDKPTKQMASLLRSLGPKYQTKVIDGELCGYLKLNDCYDIEISGINNNRKSLSTSLYLWQLKPGERIVEQVLNVSAIDEVKAILDQWIEKYTQQVPQ